jgi:8-oxo-dGTP pyrophosphatase MutT (NUDIX family)
MPIPEFVVEIRKMIGHHEMWLPGITAVVCRGPAGDEDVLLVQRADNHEWTPITGIPDPGEEPAAAAAREALEETGVVIRVDRLASTGAHPGIVHANGDRASYLDLTFACSYVSGDAHVGDEESVDVRWVHRDALPVMTPVMRRRIADALAGEQAARFVR